MHLYGAGVRLPYIRLLQRQLDLAVVLVHHTRKNTAGIAQGQGLRGSSDIHAFGDSNLYLRRTSQHLVLSSEHRAAAASPSVHLSLVAADGQATHLEVVAEPEPDRRGGVEQQVLGLLASGVVHTRAKLRDTLAINNQRLGEVLTSLEQSGRLRRTPIGWQRID